MYQSRSPAPTFTLLCNSKVPHSKLWHITPNTLCVIVTAFAVVDCLTDVYSSVLTNFWQPLSPCQTLPSTHFHSHLIHSMLTHCVTECVHVICTAEDDIMLNNVYIAHLLRPYLLQRTEATLYKRTNCVHYACSRECSRVCVFHSFSAGLDPVRLYIQHIHAYVCIYKLNS